MGLKSIRENHSLSVDKVVHEINLSLKDKEILKKAKIETVPGVYGNKAVERYENGMSNITTRNRPLILGLSIVYQLPVVRVIREALNISQKELAQRLQEKALYGNEAYVSHLESGKLDDDQKEKMIEAYAKLFGLNKEFLLLDFTKYRSNLPVKSNTGEENSKKTKMDKGLTAITNVDSVELSRAMRRAAFMGLSLGKFTEMCWQEYLKNHKVEQLTFEGM